MKDPLAKRYERELMIPLIETLASKYPHGEFFTRQDIEEITGFRVLRRLDGLEGIILRRRSPSEQRDEYGITLQNAWAVSLFPYTGTANRSHYFPKEVMDRIEKVAGMTVFGSRGRDYDLRFGPVARMPYPNAYYLRAIRDNEGKELVAQPDISRLAIRTMMCVDEETFSGIIAPALLDGHAIDSGLRSLLEGENCLSVMWELESRNGRGKSWRVLYGPQGDEKYYYHIELFADKPGLSGIIQEMWGFDDVHPAKNPKPGALRHAAKRKHKAGLKKGGATGYRRNTKRPEADREVVIRRVDSSAMRKKEYPTCEKLFSNRPDDPFTPYYTIQTPGFEDVPSKRLDVSVLGSKTELDNGGIDLFSHEIFSYLNPCTSFFALPDTPHYAGGYYRIECRHFSMSRKVIEKSLRGKDLAVLCESAYCLYDPEIMGDEGLYKGHVMFIRTGAHKYGRLEKFPEPSSFKPIEGAPIIRFKGENTFSYANRFACVAIPRILTYLEKEKVKVS